MAAIRYDFHSSNATVPSTPAPNNHSPSPRGVNLNLTPGYYDGLVVGAPDAQPKPVTQPQLPPAESLGANDVPLAERVARGNAGPPTGAPNHGYEAHVGWSSKGGFYYGAGPQGHTPVRVAQEVVGTVIRRMMPGPTPQ